MQLTDLLSGFRYSQDGLNGAVTGAVIPNLTCQVTNLVNQLKELNDVRTNSQPHITAQWREIWLTPRAYEKPGNEARYGLTEVG